MDTNRKIRKKIMLVDKQPTKLHKTCTPLPGKEIGKDKKTDSETIEEASTRFAEILIKQIELNKQHSTK